MSVHYRRGNPSRKLLRRTGQTFVIAATAFVALAGATPAFATPITSPGGGESFPIRPGDTVQAGYDFTIPGNNQSVTVKVTHPQAVVNFSCQGGGSGSFLIAMPDATSSVTGSQWYPSGDQHSSLVYQGSVTAPNGCGDGSQMHMDHQATFTADVSSNPGGVKVNYRFHNSDKTSGSWSSTNSVTSSGPGATTPPVVTPPAGKCTTGPIIPSGHTEGLIANVTPTPGGPVTGNTIAFLYSDESDIGIAANGFANPSGTIDGSALTSSAFTVGPLTTGIAVTGFQDGEKGGKGDPCQRAVSIALPSGLPGGTHTITVTVYDGDHGGDRDTETWTFTTPVTQTVQGEIYTCPSGTPTTTLASGGTIAIPALNLSASNPLTARQVSAGTYTVTGTAPAGYAFVTCGLTGTTITAPGSASQTVTVPAGGSTDAKFYIAPTVAPCTSTSSPLQSYFFVITDNGVTTTATVLRGHVHSGDTVTVIYTLGGTCATDQYSLASYDVPANYYMQGVSQTIYQHQTNTTGPGTYSLTVTVPNCYFQVDFVHGPAILTGDPAYGDSLIDADNGGTNSCS